MRITPIEEPRGIVPRIAYWASRRQLGKVMTPMKIIYARIPGLFPVAYRQARVIEHGLTIDPLMRFMVTSLVAITNGCSFCVDIGKAFATYHKLDRDKADHVAEWRTHAAFTAAERAAFEYVEEVTREHRASDATFERLRAHWDEQAIVEITWLCAQENYYNLMAVPLGIAADGLCAIAERRMAS